MGRALIALVLFAASTARAQHAPLRVPACAAVHADVVLLAELVAIEVGAEAMTIELDATLCDPSARTLSFVARAEGVVAHDAIALPSRDELASTTRALALALVERARLALATAARMRTASAPPSRVPVAPHDAPRAALDLAAGGGLAPLSLDGLVFAQLAIGATFEGTWIARAALGGGWSRGSADEGRVDVALLGLELAGGWVFARSDALEAALLARADVGVVHAVGTRRDGSSARTTTAPWCTLGLALELAWWLDPRVAIAGALGADGVIAGLEIVETSGTALALSYLIVDVALGVRIAL
ncbi:hypothetical protein [Sandaracinus amylolyticus]|uniref:Uncharacterized protein n=1 Tax=Sandaracinus amylolyticus TaxID=927083 RepID=A0A0F6SGC4_9BACT|nr:hypothetical protein [Sandaracinus amylolyticus]AKF08449.1 hypothetical protein DB32_005598 [Sandaracinus amylolyticus]